MDEQKRIIAIETSGRVGSVAAAMGAELLAEEQFSGALRHAAELLPMMDKITSGLGWKPGDIEELYVSAGPGSFTGIRIAVTLAKTLAFAQSTRIVAVPSIEAQALNAELAMGELGVDIKNIAVILEAGRGQIFTAVFSRVDDGENGKFVPGFGAVIEPMVSTCGDLLGAAPKPLYLMGEGINYHREELVGDGVTILDEKYWQPRARFVHRCGYLRAQAGLFADSDELMPMYMRRPEAVEKWEELHGKK